MKAIHKVISSELLTKQAMKNVLYAKKYLHM
jgi:hypothetical protein